MRLIVHHDILYVLGKIARWQSHDLRARRMSPSPAQFVELIFADKCIKVTSAIVCCGILGAWQIRSVARGRDSVASHK
jgi:hypothetical protein